MNKAYFLLVLIVFLPIVDARIDVRGGENAQLREEIASLLDQPQARAFGIQSASFSEKDVIVQFKEPKDMPLNNIDKLDERAFGLQVASIAASELGFTPKNRFSSFQGYSTRLTESQINALERSGLVERIYDNYEVELFLSDSKDITQARRLWDFEHLGENITGKGQTVCVIDTGIDYTHPNFGGCSDPFTHVESFSLSSQDTFDHNYTYEHNDETFYVYEWHVNMAEYSQISLFFEAVSLPAGSVLSFDTFDDVSLANYSGTLNLNDWWSWVLNNNSVKVVIDLVEPLEESSAFFNISSIIDPLEFWNCEKVIGGYDAYYNLFDSVDTHGHGTHVADIAGGIGPVRGIAPGANLVSVKVFPFNSRITNADVILSGIEWCFDNAEKFNISVISLSLGGNQFSSYCNDDVLTGIINKSVENNISVVTATGNTGSGFNNPSLGITRPACVESSIRVTSTNKDDSMSSFAFRHPFFSDILAAPGGGILAASLGGGVSVNSGTSMATPMVSGAIALFNQYATLSGEKLTRQDHVSLLNNTGVLVFDSSTSKNYSRIDIESAFTVLNQDYLRLELIADSTTFFNTSFNVSWGYVGNITSAKLNITHPNSSVVFSNNNTSGIVQLNVSTLSSIGTYNISFYGENEELSLFENSSFEVLRAVPEIMVFLNGLNDNITVNESSNITIIAESVSEGLLELFINDTLIQTNTTLNHQWTNITPGLYNVTVRHNETDFYEERTKTFFINATKVYPNITNYTPEDLNQTIMLNETIEFNATAVDELNRTITHHWYVNSENQSNNQSYQFTAEDFGVGNHNVTYIASANNRNTTKTWNVTIIHVPPTIENISPSNNDTIIVKKKFTVNFSQVSSDFYDRNLTFSWLVNGTVNSTNDSFLFESEFFDVDLYNVTLVVSNNDSTSNISWVLEVLPENIPPVFNGSISSFSLVRSSTLSDHLNLSEFFNSMDGDNLTFTLEGHERVSMSVDLDNLASFTSTSNTGFSSYRIRAFDGWDYTHSNNFTITVSSPPSPPPSSPGGGSFSIPVSSVEEPKSNETDNVTIQEVPSQTVRPVSVIKSLSENTSIIVSPLNESENVFPRKVYKYVEITLQNSSEEVFELEFFVDKNWVLDNNLTYDLIGLFKFEEDWTLLPTVFTKDNSTHYFYFAKVDAFSLFAIGEIEQPQEDKVVEEVKDQATDQERSNWFMRIIRILFFPISLLF